jgi:hypothetical protein
LAAGRLLRPFSFLPDHRMSPRAIAFNLN